MLLSYEKNRAKKRGEKRALFWEWFPRSPTFSQERISAPGRKRPFTARGETGQQRERIFKGEGKTTQFEGRKKMKRKSGNSV